jgi:hypothetical protein
MSKKTSVSCHSVHFKLTSIYHSTLCTNTAISFFLRWLARASSYNSNKLTNQMQQFYKFITWLLFHSTCFGRLHANHQELTTALTASGFTLERGGSSAVSRGLASSIGSSAMAVLVTITGNHTPPYLMGTRCSFSGDKLAGPQSSLLFFM